MSSPFLDEATRIGNLFIETAKHDDHGTSWQTMTYTELGRVQRASEDVYSGVSGIALFLLELYKHTSNEKYLLASEKAMEWVEWYCHTHPAQNYAFITGRMGVTYVFLQLYQVTNKQKYLRKALKIGRQCENFIGAPKEYLSGVAGTLLGLIHLHAASNEAWLLEMINDCVRSLVKSAQLGEVGLYWERDSQQIRPLCGFSHGVAGIGFVFTELGYYFDNPAFYMIADQAFAYENAWFDPKTGNWPDFRLDTVSKINSVKLKKQYIAGDQSDFISPGDKNAWCHGAAGIALARCRAYKLTGNESYLRDLRDALAKVKQTETGLHANAVLCHGISGNAEGLIEYSQLFRDEEYRRLAERFGETVLQQKQQYGKYIGNSGVASDNPEDISLFNGLAGIGYFFLRLHDPRKTPSILSPKLVSKRPTMKLPKSLPFLAIRPSGLRKQLIANIFPKTLELTEQHAPQETKKHFAKNAKPQSLKKSFVQFMNDMPRESDAQQHIARTFSFEQLKTELINRYPSSGLLYIKEQLNQKTVKRLLKLSDAALMRYSLQFAEECRLFALGNDDLHLLKLTTARVEDQNISQFCYIVLGIFADGRQIRQAVDIIAQHYNARSEEEVSIVKEKVISQIKEALRSSVLLPAKS